MGSCNVKEERITWILEPRAWLGLHALGVWHGPEGELGRVEFKVWSWIKKSLHCVFGVGEGRGEMGR